MEITEKKPETGHLVLCVSGDVILTTSGVLRERLNRAIQEEEYKKITLDLADISHIDSSGIGTIVRSEAAFSERNGELRILLSEKFMDVFIMMKLDEYLNISVKKGRKKKPPEAADTPAAQ